MSILLWNINGSVMRMQQRKEITGAELCTYCLLCIDLNIYWPKMLPLIYCNSYPILLKELKLQCFECYAIICGCKLTKAAQTDTIESIYDFIVNGITPCNIPNDLSL